MRRPGLAGITLLAIALVSISIYTSQEPGKKPLSSSAAKMSKAVPAENEKTVVVEVATSADWASEAAFKTHDY